MKAKLPNNKFNLKGSADIIKLIEQSYKGWLDYSNLTESELLKYSVMRPFVIKKTYENKCAVVNIGIGGTDKFHPIGQPFVSAEESHNSDFLIDLALLLFYISTKLDMQNKKSVHFKKTNNEKDDYFYQIVKEFVNNENLQISK